MGNVHDINELGKQVQVVKDRAQRAHDLLAMIERATKIENNIEMGGDGIYSIQFYAPGENGRGEVIGNEQIGLESGELNEELKEKILDVVTSARVRAGKELDRILNSTQYPEGANN